MLEVEDNQLVVVDPQKPSSDRRYVLELRPSRDPIGPQIFLLNPAGIPRHRDRVFEINTVFTIKLTANPGSSLDDLSIEQVNKIIDETAGKLQGTDNFLNPREWRSRTAGFGLPGLDLPVEEGGKGWSAKKVIRVFEHAGWHNLNFRDVVGGAHARLLLRSQAPEVKTIVQQVAQGTGYVAVAITEPGAGSDVEAIESSARRVSGGYRISGTKLFNARLDQATHVIIFARVSGDARNKLSVFVLPIDASGLSKTNLVAHGLTGNSFGGLDMNNVFVPESNRIGGEGDGLSLFMTHFLYWRLMQTAAAIGTGENALNQMADRIKTRQAFGGPIGRFTHLQQALGQHETELSMARALAMQAAELIDAGDYEAARPLVNGLKAEGVEIALKAVDSAMRAFGGEGYSTRVDLGDRLKDLRFIRVKRARGA